MTISGSNLKLDPEMVMLPQIPQIWEGSGNLIGWVFLENPTLFLEMGNLFRGQNGGTPGCPRVLLTPTTTISRTFYSLTSIFTSETSERERKLASKSSHTIASHVFEKNLFVSL